MQTIAVTGHMDLTAASMERVRNALRQTLAGEVGADSGMVGVSCLAPGADSLFAETVLEAEGDQIVVLPSRDYRRVQVGPEHAPVFDHLMKAASEVVVMPFATAERRAYEAANSELVRRADTLVAVWDGTPPSGRGGGTADTVLKARRAGVPVHVVWPDGASRHGQDPPQTARQGAGRRGG